MEGLNKKLCLYYDQKNGGCNGEYRPMRCPNYKPGRICGSRGGNVAWHGDKKNKPIYPDMSQNYS